jgi:plastocyanin
MLRDPKFQERKWVLASSLAILMGAGVSCDNGLDLTGPSDAPRTASVSIRAGGFDPLYVAVRPGGQVTFTNDDTVAHQVASDPHPAHSGCPELNSPVLQPGQRYQAAMGSTNRLTCGYHDEERLDVSGFRATVAVCQQTSLFGC